MVSGYHLEVAKHYENFPYPSYPIFSFGSWRGLESVDCSKWGAKIPVRDIWIAGCGTIAPLMFARRNHRANIVASDLSQSTLQICSKRLSLFGARNILLKCEDIFDARYENSFDAIDAYGVIHHTISPQKSLEIFMKALRAGGVLRFMVYSAEVRSQIENLRKAAKEQNLTTLEEAKTFLKKEGVSERGDLSHDSGIADAILNPMVHVFNRENLDQLLSSIKSAEIVRIDDKSNFIIFLRKL